MPQRQSRSEHVGELFPPFTQEGLLDAHCVAHFQVPLEVLRKGANTVGVRAADADGKRVTAAIVRRRDGSIDRVRADVFVDATGDVYVCRSAGCETTIGESLNGVTLCYRVSKRGTESPDVLAAEPFQRSSCNHQLPNGDRIINMLPTVEGRLLLELGYGETLKTCQERIRQHWAWLRKSPGDWGQYRFADAASLLGIREGHRIVGEYVLTAGDLEQGIGNQPHADMIAMASHGVDIHGKHRAKRHVAVRPYGIPYRCLVPKGWQNVLVACRGASFDRTAASSVRLSRTMVWLGHAAGIASAMAVRQQCPVMDVDVAELVKRMGVNSDTAANKEPGDRPFKPSDAAVAGTQKHSFYCTDNGHGKVLKFDEKGACVWEYPAPRCQDVWALPNGNTVVCNWLGHGQYGQGIPVSEVTPEKQIVWMFRDNQRTRSVSSVCVLDHRPPVR